MRLWYRPDLPPGSFLVGLGSVVWREAWKYGERAFRYCQHDVGHAVGSLSYAAACLGWRMEVLAAPGDDEVAGGSAWIGRMPATAMSGNIPT